MIMPAAALPFHQSEMPGQTRGDKKKGGPLIALISADIIFAALIRKTRRDRRFRSSAFVELTFYLVISFWMLFQYFKLEILSNIKLNRLWVNPCEGTTFPYGLPVLKQGL